MNRCRSDYGARGGPLGFDVPQGNWETCATLDCQKPCAPLYLSGSVGSLDDPCSAVGSWRWSCPPAPPECTCTTTGAGHGFLTVPDAALSGEAFTEGALELRFDPASCTVTGPTDACGWTLRFAFGATGGHFAKTYSCLDGLGGCAPCGVAECELTRFE